MGTLVPAILVALLIAMAGCALLFVSLGWYTIKLFLIWAVIGLVVYFGWSRQRSHLANGTEHVS